MTKKKSKKRKSRKSRKTRRKNPTRKCSICRSAKHDRRKCKSKKRKNSKRRNPDDFFSGKNMRAEWKKLMDQGVTPTFAVPRMQEIFGMNWSGIRRKLGKKFGSLPFSRNMRRRNPGMDSLASMGLSYSYTKPRHNPCVTCGCTCRDGSIDLTRTTINRRRNPGWSFKKGRVVPHEQKLEGLYQRPASRKLSRRSSASPFRRNSCGKSHKPTRNPDCWMCDDTGYKGNDLCHCPAGNARSGANRYFRNPAHQTHKYCRDDRIF